MVILLCDFILISDFQRGFSSVNYFYDTRRSPKKNHEKWTTKSNFNTLECYREVLAPVTSTFIDQVRSGKDLRNFLWVCVCVCVCVCSISHWKWMTKWIEKNVHYSGEERFPSPPPECLREGRGGEIPTWPSVASKIPPPSDPPLIMILIVPLCIF